MTLCAYKHVFGREGEGIHSLRLFGVAIIDVAGTVLAAFALSRAFKINVAWTLIGLFIVAIVVHRAFCVNTAVNRVLFGTV